MTTARTRAEMERSAKERQAKRAQLEYDIALQVRAEQTVRLRALRLAKEASDRKRAKIQIPAQNVEIDE